MSPDVAADPSATVARVKRWYHCIEVAPGVVTPGLFDLRPVVERMPWPDVRGLRCLDVGTADGFLAFELERRRAGEVVALDIPDPEDWDWEAHTARSGPEYVRAVAGPELGAGLRTARELRGSAVTVSSGSVYDLNPARLGTFDVVVCGSLLLHLRDPLRALTAIRSVCRGCLLCTNQLDLGRTVTHPRTPLFRLDGVSGITQWWIPNAAGHRRILRAAGFKVERVSRPYSIPFGPAHPPRGMSPRALGHTLTQLVVTGGRGVPHLAVLARA
ncbi:MAG: methyltransferase domain-containing protein [Solirubrobacteraceae bacterium]